MTPAPLPYLSYLYYLSTNQRAAAPPLAATHLAARAGAPDPPKQESHGTLDQRGVLRKKERG